jgi:hypothetical protein
MSDDLADGGPQDIPDGLNELTDLVKSRILDRVIADLHDALRLGSRVSGYTRSDSGIYGKYQKHDSVDMTRILQAIKVETERQLAEHIARMGECGTEDASNSEIDDAS